MKLFSTHWKASTHPRKQRKYRFHAPLHLRQKLVHVHLSPELRAKHGKRNVQVRKGDTVRVLRGQFSRKEGKVTRVDLQRSKVFVQGLDQIKKEGSRIPWGFAPSRLLLIVVGTEDKKRQQKLTPRTPVQRASQKSPSGKASPSVSSSASSFVSPHSRSP